ncbi:MAG: T9SS type A sorting domain-containing protein [Bacteroidales bacterium]|nr:T9SS type A sorting domain-containing protein [Bacteroidales bacterium]
MAYGQEVLMGLSSKRMPPAWKSIDTVTLTLPFFDDFSGYEGYPSPALWLSTQALVGKTYAREAPTVGMVTLDALDANGDLYPQASTNPFTADTLASQPIRLDSVMGTIRRALTPADSIMLSFFYLPGGWYGNPQNLIGSTPSPQDSLFLDFYCPSDSSWHVAWAIPGRNADTTGSRSHWPWRFASVKIDDQRFLTSQFRFRFRNYASLDDNPKSGIAGNCDQWNIDYVYLNYGRTSADSTYRDIAFVEQAPSMLQHYRYMPARQFTVADMASSIDMRIVNRYNQTLASNYSYHVYDENGSQVASYEGGLENIPAFFPDGQYQTKPVHSTPPVGFSFPVGGSQTTFEVVHIVREGVGGDIHQTNDTLRFRQVFADYLAYDDGSPENGYGVTKQGPTSGKMYIACRYKLNRQDTLTAVDLFFNRTRGAENEQVPFVLCIWSCRNGVPSTLIHQSNTVYTPHFDGLNRYHRYKLDHPVLVQDTIFVGFEQRSTDFINLGFDRNTDSRRETFIRVSNEWAQSIWTGSVMMRPCFGLSALVGIDDAEDASRQPELLLFPNPTHDILNIKTSGIETSGALVEIIDIHGHKMISSPLGNTISTANLPSGMYLLIVTDSTATKRITTRFVKQ